MARAVYPLPPPEGDTLLELSDAQLWNAQVLMDLACGRRRSSVTRRREAYACFLGRVLKVEQLRRGAPDPPSNPSVADLKRA